MEYMERDCGEGRCRDMFWEFIYIVVIPGAILFITVFITSILMCCHCCKRKKSDIIADEAQLMQYNSIRRASLNLRHLSHNRDTPLLSARADREARTASLNLERDPRYRRGGRATLSAPGTLQRERQHRHQRDRYSEIFPPHFTVSPGDTEQTKPKSADDSGVQYAELSYDLMKKPSKSADV